MKRIIVLSIYFFAQNLIAQITCIYKVVNTTRTPKMGMSPELEIEMKIEIDNKHYYIETRLINNQSNLNYSGQLKSTLIDFNTNLVYSFDENLSIVESYHLAMDTLINTGEKARYGKYSCEVYKAKKQTCRKALLF